MLLSHPKISAIGELVLVAFLLQACAAVHGASVPRYHRYRGDEAEDRRPAAYLPPSSDMVKALEYIENLKQRKDAGQREEPTDDDDEVEKFRVLLQLASLQDQGARQSPPPAQRQDVPTEQLVRALLRTLQEQGSRDPKPAAPVAPATDRRPHRHHSEDGGSPARPEYGNFPRPHKKYPLMFEDEENRDAYKRATEDLEEQYTPQSLANLRSIFDELGRMATVTNGQKRDVLEDDDDDNDEDMFSLRNLAYEDVAGGEEWIPLEERVETEEMVNGSHEEFERGLEEPSDEEEAEGGAMQRRASQSDQPATTDDTKLVDYFLLKVLEMSDQTQKRDNKKRLIRPSMVDPRMVNELLEISLKLHIPPEELMDMLITELRKTDHQAQASAHYRTSSSGKPRIRYYSRRLPVKQPAPDNMDREDFLKIIGVETISNEYPVRQRPLKPTSTLARVAAPPAPAIVKAPPPAPAKVMSSIGRQNMFLSELNKMPLKRQSSDDDDEDDEVDDVDEVFLAAKILTQYPNTISKRDTQSQTNGQFPYELYEQAMKDFFDQADTGKSTIAKRDTEMATEHAEQPTETQVKDEVVEGTTAPPQKDEGKERRGKPGAVM